MTATTRLHRLFIADPGGPLALHVAEAAWDSGRFHLDLFPLDCCGMDRLPMGDHEHGASDLGSRLSLADAILMPVEARIPTDRLLRLIDSQTKALARCPVGLVTDGGAVDTNRTLRTIQHRLADTGITSHHWLLPEPALPAALQAWIRGNRRTPAGATVQGARLK
jgi:hypothetical protein